MRLDVRMTELGLAASREKARAMIMAGEVLVDGRPASKPGSDVSPDAEITVKADPVPFVSRGGLKLQKAVDVFGLDLTDAAAADIGASTGGFTDCMLQHGARRVYAVDVGYGQLDWSLRNDPRVVIMERTNARNLQPDWFESLLDFASIDVSFISLRLILPPLFACLGPGARVVALIKPQFEAGRGQVGKHGVVRDAAVHAAVCREIVAFSKELGFAVEGLSFSPIKGPKGNIEFLLLLRRPLAEEDAVSVEPDVDSLIAEAHGAL